MQPHDPWTAQVRVDDAPPPTDAKGRLDVSLIVLWLAIAGLLLARIPLLWLRSIDPDEFEYVHSAWYVWQGWLPYRDFFEHHTPWYDYFLSPFFGLFEVDTSFASARLFFILARSLSWVLAVLSILLSISLGRMLQERRAVPLCAGLLLAGQHVFLQKTLEVRPDVLALPFLLGGLWLTLRGMDGVAVPPGRHLWHFLLGGLGIGAAIMCTQKMLFVLPGAFVGVGLWAIGARGSLGGRGRLLASAAFVDGVGVPGFLTWAGFAVLGGGGAFIENNFLLNFRWNYTVHEQLLKVLETSWPVLILCLLGATVSLYRCPRSRQGRFGAVLLLSILLGLIAGIPVIPVAHRQYYLIMTPFISLFAAEGLLFLVDRASVDWRQRVLLLALVPLSVLRTASEDGMIAGPTMVARVVARQRALVVAEDRLHRGVDVQVKKLSALGQTTPTVDDTEWRG